MQTFWSLLKESVITQALLTLMIWGAVIYMVVIGQPIPDILAVAASAILGFWFGTKIKYDAAKGG